MEVRKEYGLDIVTREITITKRKNMSWSQMSGQAAFKSSVLSRNLQYMEKKFYSTVPQYSLREMKENHTLRHIYKEHYTLRITVPQDGMCRIRHPVLF